MGNPSNSPSSYYDDFYKKKDWNNKSFIVKGKVKTYLKLATSVSPKKITKIVDAGCGTGIYSHILQSMNFDVSGFDFSEVAISKAKEKYRSIDFRVLDGRKINYAPNIDCILASGFSLFNTLDTDKTTSLIEHWRSFLTHKGLILITSKTDLSERSPTGWIYHSEKDLLQLYAKEDINKKVVFLFPPLWIIVSILPKSKLLTKFISNFSKNIIVKLFKRPVTAICILQNNE